MSPKRVAAPLDIYLRVSDVRGRSGESFISPCSAASTAEAASKERHEWSTATPSHTEGVGRSALFTP
jgi:hypothetical protein